MAKNSAGLSFRQSVDLMVDRALENLDKAIEVAHRQEARWWELRATIDLARMLHEQGSPAEAYQRLFSIYNWFTEGFDTSDLLEAKALLDELS